MTQTTFTDNVLIDGSQDTKQLRVQGHTTQTNALQTWENSAGGILSQLTGDGRLQVGDDVGLPTPDALVEAHRAETSSAKPKRGFHSLGRITDALSSVVNWAVAELELLGTAGISALHSALRVKLTNQNTGTMTGGADLRAGDFEVVNSGGSSPVPKLTAVQAVVTNNSGAAVTDAVGLKVAINNAGTITNPYAIYTDPGGIVHLGDTLELQRPAAVPGTPATDLMRVYPKSDGKLYAKNWSGVEYDLTVPLLRGIVDGRLTLASGNPVPIGDVLAATTLYFTPYKGSQVALYDGAAWKLYNFTELSLSLASASANTPYDIFLYDNAGTLTLEAVAWTNDTTRATALVLQDGVYVKSGAATRRYLGTIRTTGTAGQYEDSQARRFVWNYDHRRLRKLKRIDTTDSWTYATAAWRAARNDSNNKVECVIGLSEDLVTATCHHKLVTATTERGGVGIGLDSTTANSADLFEEAGGANAAGTTIAVGISAFYRGYPGIGYHYLAWLEYARSGTVDYQGDNGLADQQAGLLAEVWA